MEVPGRGGQERWRCGARSVSVGGSQEGWRNSGHKDWV